MVETNTIQYIGIELNPEYIPLAEERLRQIKPPYLPRNTEESSCGANFVFGGEKIYG